MTNSVEPPLPVRTGRTRSNCRAAPVSHNQVRQREQHIQFGGLFWQTSVSRFSIPELPLYDRKYVFYLSSYRRLLMLRLLCSPLPTCRQLLNLRWLTILLVSDFFPACSERWHPAAFPPRYIRCLRINSLRRAKTICSFACSYPYYSTLLPNFQCFCFAR